MGIFIILVHNVKFFVDKGIDKMSAAFVFALVGGVSSGFRIFWGWLSDRIGREITYTMGMMCICVGVGALILFDTLGERLSLSLFVVFFGIGWGVTAPLFISVAVDLFKGKTFGLIYGLAEGVNGVGAAFGAWVAGFIFDKTESYQWAFMLAISVFVLSCVSLWVTAPRKVIRSRL